MEEVENFLEENQAVKELAGAYLDVICLLYTSRCV